MLESEEKMGLLGMGLDYPALPHFFCWFTYIKNPMFWLRMPLLMLSFVLCNSSREILMFKRYLEGVVLAVGHRGVNRDPTLLLEFLWLTAFVILRSEAYSCDDIFFI